MNNVLNALQKDLLFDIESNVRSKLNTIVKELKIGKTDSLQKMSYFICGDPTSMKVYEIESYLINEELSLLKPSQLAMLWLATDDGADYYDTELNELPYEEYDVFNYAYNNIELYDSYNYSEEDFLKLLDRQCWLETTLEECKIAYKKLHDEVINNIQYDDFNALIPNFVDAIEDVQFYYIYGNGVDSLSFKEYEKHLLYKLITLIKKENIDKSFFIELTGSYKDFDHFLDNYEFYSLLSPIYFAQKIMETEEFRFLLDFHIDKEIEFISLYSKTIANMADENDEKFSAFTDKILNTTIHDISNYGSEEYNKLVYNNSDQRYDHDLSRFLQYTHTLKNSDEESTRLLVYTSLKKELEDEYNTIRSSIEDFIKKEFPEYKNKKTRDKSIFKRKSHLKKYDMKGIIKNFFLVPILYVYLIGIGTSATYFNWQFAKENGFTKWLFFGEIVPTVKGVIWPYYTSQYFLSKTPNNDVVISQIAELDALIQSIEMRNKAMEMIEMIEIDPIEHKGVMNKNDFKVFLNLLQKSLEESKKVSDESLNRIDPLFVYHYRNEFQKGLVLYINGFSEGNNEMFHEGENYLDKFGEWYNTFSKKHKDKI